MRVSSFTVFLYHRGQWKQLDMIIQLTNPFSSLFAKKQIETPLSAVEEAFQEFAKRKDIAIILINQHVTIKPCFERKKSEQCSALLSLNYGQTSRP